MPQTVQVVLYAVESCRCGAPATDVVLAHDIARAETMRRSVATVTMTCGKCLVEDMGRAAGLLAERRADAEAVLSRMQRPPLPTGDDRPTVLDEGEPWVQEMRADQQRGDSA